MKLAVLTDIHGNLSALEAVLEHLEKNKPDDVIVAGDSINIQPDSRACWERLQTLGFRCLRGNHERYVYDYNTARAEPEWSEERFKLLGWMHSQFSKGALHSMRHLPMSYRIEGVLITHASCQSDQDSLSESTSETELATMFPDAAKLVIRGHQHRWGLRQWAKGSIITLGSLGIPLNTTGQSQYLSLEKRQDGWHYQHHLIDYDRYKALAQMNAEYLENAGPLGKIFKLELATAEAQVMPFFHSYFSALAKAELSLKQAVDRYLEAFY